MVSCTGGPGRDAPAGTGAGAAVEIDPGDAAALDALLADISDRRVIYVGEIHDRYDHHQNQLAVIRGLHERGVKLAIGLESFQEPFQEHLDAFSAGRMGEKDMLRRTEYFTRWRFDYRLYRDILDYARRHEIPLVALNAPTEMVEAVSRDGVEGLSPEYRRRLPARIQPADADYERRLRDAFRMHGDLPEERFRRFMEVQSVWDEYMARRAAEYLAAHPDRTLVVLAGAAHVLHDAAIPQRLRRYRPVEQAVIVTRPFEPLPGVAPDFVFPERELALEPPGRLGMSLAGGEDGVVRVHSITARGAAQQAGLSVGDRVLSIADTPIDGLADVRVAMLYATPGDRVRVTAERGSGPAARRITRVLTLM
jgi:uncharacterized iron-regulated protein